MTRFILSLSIVVLLVAWADAQQTGGLLAADRVRLLEANRTLVEKMISHTVEISDENDALKRATTCHKAMKVLAIELNAAIRGQDANRISELGDHLADLASNGLAPCFIAGKEYAPDSDPAREMKKLHETTVKEITQLESSVTRTGPLGQSRQVRQTLEKWRAVVKSLNEQP